MGGNFKNRNKIKAPVERLDRCHRKLEGRLKELATSVKAIVDGRSEARHWSVVADVLAYLERAVARHEEDEEASVFPHLATHPALRPFLNRLRGDHESQRKLVASLAKLVADHSAPHASASLKRVSSALIASYLDHIKREDHELLPAITHYISAEAQAEIAQEMAARRED